MWWSCELPGLEINRFCCKMKRQQILLVTFCLAALFTQSMARSTKSDQSVIVDETSGREDKFLARTQRNARPAYTDLVVRGQPVNVTAWPWIVGVFEIGPDGPFFVCGGTLVSRHVVVTAAHCVTLYRKYVLDKRDVLLVMGRTEVQNWDQQTTVQQRNAQAVVVHPTYLQSNANDSEYSDVAFLELDHPITITKNVIPIGLWEDESVYQRIGNIGTVVGWGRDENNVSVTETPRKTQLPIVDKQTCLDSNSLLQSFVHDLTYCAGNRDGTGPCNGDSGSGMYVVATARNGKKSWILRGIVSRSVTLGDGSGLCDLNNYLVFTDMAKLKPWLTETSCSFKHPRTFSALNMTKLGDKYYYFELDWRKRLNWTSAQQFCRSHDLQLAIVETEEENNLIGESFRGKVPEYWAWWDFWLGGSDSQQEGTWRWTNGQPLNFTDWRPGNPSNYSEDYDCLWMLVWSDGTHEWEDFSCSYETWFVCELEDVCS